MRYEIDAPVMLYLYLVLPDGRRQLAHYPLCPSPLHRQPKPEAADLSCRQDRPREDRLAARRTVVMERGTSSRCKEAMQRAGLDGLHVPPSFSPQGAQSGMPGVGKSGLLKAFFREYRNARTETFRESIRRRAHLIERLMELQRTASTVHRKGLDPRDKSPRRSEPDALGKQLQMVARALSDRHRQSGAPVTALQVQASRKRSRGR